MRNARSMAMWGATGLTLAAGYLLLETGESTVSAVLLVIGYVVLAPCAIHLSYNSARCLSPLKK